MGAKTWMLVLADSDARQALAVRPELDREGTRRLVTQLFPREKLEPLPDGTLSCTNPPDGEIYAGCFSGVSVLAAKEFGGDYPSRLPRRYIDAGGGTVILHAMHSVVDWFAFGVWKQGQLQRALSMSPDSGILENIGQPLPFEQPYWSGAKSEGDDYPLPFHPLELGEAALKELFGYVLEGEWDESLLDPDKVMLAHFKRCRSPWWKFW